MKRLTIEYDGQYAPVNLCTIDRLGGADDCEPCHPECDADCNKCYVQACFNRLAAYEDTGLMPEDILTGIELAQLACMQIRYKQMRELMEQAAEVIENLYGRETDLSSKIRDQLEE